MSVTLLEYNQTFLCARKIAACERKRDEEHCAIRLQLPLLLGLYLISCRRRADASVSACLFLLDQHNQRPADAMRYKVKSSTLRSFSLRGKPLLVHKFAILWEELERKRLGRKELLQFLISRNNSINNTILLLVALFLHPSGRNKLKCPGRKYQRTELQREGKNHEYWPSNAPQATKTSFKFSELVFYYIPSSPFIK